MRYKTDENNYISAVFFNCYIGTCAEYTGTVPTGYTSLEDWASNANIEAYKIVDNNLVYDSARDAELQAQWAREEERCNPKIPTNYSTEEQIIGTWTDKRPLYRKLIEFPNGTGTTSTFKKSLSELGITNVKHIHVGVPSYYTYSNQHYPFSYYDGNSKFEVNVSPTDLRIICGNSTIANNEILITLEYTKTTD